MLTYLRVVVPAAAALAWAWQRLHNRESTPPPQPAADQEEGEEAQLELPGGKGPQLPFVAPPPLRTPLLDATVPLSLPALWLAFFHNASSLLADFHQRLGDRDVYIASWRRLKDGQRRRLLRYTTPLRNPLGPRQAFNTEVLEAAQLAPGGFALHARCDSEGVPFASSFANHVQWVATPAGPHSCRLVVTGECRFSRPVWGPLKGQIERESAKGMVKAYRTLFHMLERQYGATESGGAADGSNPNGSAGAAAAGPSGKAARGDRLALGADGSSAGAAAAAAAAAVQEGEGANIAALLANPQTNAAAFLVIVMVMVLIWRLAFMQPALLQAMRGVASAVAQR